MKKRPRSAGVRNPAVLAVIHGFCMAAGLAPILMGVRGGDAWMVTVGILPALLCPIFFVYYLSRIKVFGDMRSGRTAIARWTVPAAQFREFCEEEDRVPAGSIAVNFYRPPREVPAEGVEVIFSDSGVLIGGGYFPLSPTGGRRLQSVTYKAAYPPAIEFDMLLTTSVSKSSNTFASRRALQSLRVPVAMASRKQAGDVVRCYETILCRA